MIIRKLCFAVSVRIIEMFFLNDCLTERVEYSEVFGVFKQFKFYDHGRN
jgi:hypothetical protein